MAVLYRKYRPQTFADVLSQKPIVRTLTNQVKSGSFAHAYLFTGSRGVGKTSVARILAKAVNCLHQAPTTPSRQGGTPLLKEEGNTALGDACGVCEVCKQIEAGKFLDLVEIDAASNTGVDNIRDLIEHVKFSPTSGKYKVFIIDEVHMLSKGAFNALLKTLEEPPKHAVFILATTEINKVPPTIISRTQRFDFKAYAPAELKSLLEKICAEENFKISGEVLDLVAQNAEGGARDALSLLDKVMSLGSEPGLEESQALLGITDIAVCEKLLELIALGKAAEIPGFFSALAERGADYTILNRDFLEYSRKALVFKVTDGQQGFNLSDDHTRKLRDLAGKFSLNEIIFVIRLFLKSYKDLAGAPAAEIPMLLAALEAGLKKSALSSSASVPSRPTSVPQSGIPLRGASDEESRDMSSSVNHEPVSTPSFAEAMEGKRPNIQESIVIEEAGEAMTLPEVRQVWPKVIEKIKAINSPLASLLRNGELLDVLGSKIILGVKFLFNKQNLEHPKNFTLICETFEQVAGKKMAVSAQVIKQEEVRIDTAQALSNALQVFGGELIE